MENKPNTPVEKSLFNELMKIQEALKPAGYTVCGYKQKRRYMVLHLDKLLMYHPPEKTDA
jgi:hypothetical protein